jgi:hypothetical protein
MFYTVLFGLLRSLCEKYSDKNSPQLRLFMEEQVQRKYTVCCKTRDISSRLNKHNFSTSLLIR